MAATAFFTVPGESSLAVLDALHDTPEIDTIVCRQEGRVAYMADADGKMTGRPGIGFVTRGPGAFALTESFGSEGGKEGLESYQVVKAIHQA
jgi:thiamine pyrophosphate-dependent acetolactate synthase large subunit-like protein